MLHSRLTGSLCGLLLVAASARCQEPDTGRAAMMLREMIERASWPDEEWSDPALLLWSLDHPPDPVSRSPEDPPGIHSRGRAARSARARVYRGWITANGAHLRGSRVDLSAEVSRGFAAELGWVEQKGAEGIRRTIGGGVEAHDLGCVRDAVVGHYRFGAAEGLVFGNGLPGRGRQRGSGPRGEIGLMIPGLSGGAYYFGAILRCGLPSWQEGPDLTVCYSRTVLDQARAVPGLVDADRDAGDEAGGQAPDQAAGEAAVKSLRGVTELLWGFRLRCPLARWLVVSANGAAASLEGPEENGEERSGNARFAGIDLLAPFGPGLFSAEISCRSPGHPAVGGRLELVLRNDLRIAAGGRLFGDGYWNPHLSGSIGDGDARSEGSAWAWCAADPLPWLRFELATEFARRLCFGGRLPLYLSTSRMAARLEVQPSEALRVVVGLSVRGREQSRASAGSVVAAGLEVMEWRTWVARAELNLASGRGLDWWIRMAGTAAADPRRANSDRGFLVGAGSRWEPSEEVRLEFRFNVFGTDSYDSRIYVGEQSVPGRARFVMLYGEGERAGVWLRLRPVRGVGITLSAVTGRRCGDPLPGAGKGTEYSAQWDLRI